MCIFFSSSQPLNPSSLTFSPTAINALIVQSQMHRAKFFDSSFLKNHDVCLFFFFHLNQRIFIVRHDFYSSFEYVILRMKKKRKNNTHTHARAPAHRTQERKTMFFVYQTYDLVSSHGPSNSNFSFRFHGQRAKNERNTQSRY